MLELPPASLKPVRDKRTLTLICANAPAHQLWFKLMGALTTHGAPRPFVVGQETCTMAVNHQDGNTLVMRAAGISPAQAITALQLTIVIADNVSGPTPHAVCSLELVATATSDSTTTAFETLRDMLINTLPDASVRADSPSSTMHTAA